MNPYSRGLPHLAAAGGSAAIVEKLIQLGFAMNRKNELGWTPLHAAAEKGHSEVIGHTCYLRGAGHQCKNALRQERLQHRRRHGPREVSDLLKEKGADLSDQKFPGPERTVPWTGRARDQASAFRLGYRHDSVHASWQHRLHAGRPRGLLVGHIPRGRLRQARLPDPHDDTAAWAMARAAARPFCRVEYQDDCPYVAPDGQKIFFLSKRPLKPGEPLADRENIWSAERQGRWLGGAAVFGRRDQFAVRSLAGLNGSERRPLFQRAGSGWEGPCAISSSRGARTGNT